MPAWLLMIDQWVSREKEDCVWVGKGWAWMCTSDATAKPKAGAVQLPARYLTASPYVRV